MTPEAFGILYTRVLKNLEKTGWHWFSYHFNNVPTKFAMSIFRSCASIDEHAPFIGTTLLDELTNIGGRDRDEGQYEQLLQKMSEILVIERIVTCDWPSGTTFEHEPAARPGGPRPELLITSENKKIVVEVKTPSLLDHIRKRGANPNQLAYRSDMSKSLAEMFSKDADVTLPRDNTILSFMRDANRKFADFRNDSRAVTILIIVWDDYIYEPISVLVNEHTGILTEQSFSRDKDGNAEKFASIDVIIALRHLNYFISGSREEYIPDRQHPMDFGDSRSVPNVMFKCPNGREIPKTLAERFRAIPHDNPELRMFAEYNPQDYVMWIDTP